MKKFLLICFLFPLSVFAQTHLTSYNTGTSFACIAVDSNYNIWAGRANGAYLLNKASNPAANQFQSVAGTTNFNVQALLADRNQNMWAGHNGSGGTFSGGGGMERIPINSTGGLQHYSPDRNAECFTFFARDGLATLNCAGLALSSNNTIWSAHRYHDLTSSPDYIVTPGALSFKPATSLKFFSKGTYQDYTANTESPELPYPAYTCNAPISQTPQSRNVYSVASGSNQVWISVAPYISKRTLSSFPARILKYNLDGSYANTAFNFNDIGIPAGGVFNGLYVSPQGDVWVTMTAGKGFAVRRNDNWIYVNTSNACIFPSPGAIINNNAIWGNKLGQVFIGTNQGLIVYRGNGPVDSKNSYTLYSVANFGFISDQVLAGASEKDSIQWIATSNGIMRTKLGSNFPISVNNFNYTMCSNPATVAAIGVIESKITNPLASSQRDYHSYNVETEVCTTAGPNGRNCNAEYVYKLMKNDATLTGPTPFDFPYDNLASALLLGADIATITIEVNQRVNAWNPASGNGNENGGIKYIRQVLSPAYAALNFVSILNAKIPFVSEFVDRNRRAYWMETQRAENPPDVKACGSYNLYNSPYFINDRIGYDLSFDNWFCGNQLTSFTYDQIWMIPNDSLLTFTNYTQPGHFLYPGKVLRTVVEECGKVKIVSIGTGLSYCGNTTTGKMNAVGNIIVGSILFKNIDLRLKKAFAAAQ